MIIIFHMKKLRLSKLNGLPVLIYIRFRTLSYNIAEEGAWEKKRSKPSLITVSDQVLIVTYLELHAPPLVILTPGFLNDTWESVLNMFLPYFANISHYCWDFMKEEILEWCRTLTS